MPDAFAVVQFAVSTLFLVAKPGPASASASILAVSRGMPAAWAVIAGNASATITFITLTWGAFPILAQLSTQMLPVLELLGGLYLIAVGLSYWRRPDDRLSNDVSRGYVSLPGWAIFLDRYFEVMTRPVVFLFLIALLPRAIDLDSAIAPQIFLLGGFFVLLDIAVLWARARWARHRAPAHGDGHRNLHKAAGLGLASVGVTLIYQGWQGAAWFP